MVFRTVKQKLLHRPAKLLHFLLATCTADVEKNFSHSDGDFVVFVELLPTTHSSFWLNVLDTQVAVKLCVLSGTSADACAGRQKSKITHHCYESLLKNMLSYTASRMTRRRSKFKRAQSSRMYCKKWAEYYSMLF